MSYAENRLDLLGRPGEDEHIGESVAGTFGRLVAGAAAEPGWSPEITSASPQIRSNSETMA